MRFAALDFSALFIARVVSSYYFYHLGDHLDAPLVHNLHPAPWFQADRLAGGKRHFPERLNPQEFPALLLMASAAAFFADNLPHFRHERPRQPSLQFTGSIPIICFSYIREHSELSIVMPDAPK
jgi:hypothetical protein